MLATNRAASLAQEASPAPPVEQSAAPDSLHAIIREMGFNAS